MTSDEIKVAEPYAKGHKEMFWLREIAYQLAVMNERNAVLDAHILDVDNQEASKQISDAELSIIELKDRKQQ